MKLNDRTAIVTGAARGIGAAIASRFAVEGANVVIADVDFDMARKTSDEIGRRAVAVQTDVANKDEVLKMVDRSIKEFGKIDILVNNAGITGRASTLEANKAEWEKVLGVNLLGTYWCIQAVVPHMIKQKYGKIINISSVGGIGTSGSAQTEGAIVYEASKAAVILITKKRANRLGPYNINVNAIAPGIINTEGARVLLRTAGRREEEIKKLHLEMANKLALRRIGEPQDIANVALFLASDESSFITGQVIVADGGMASFLSHSV